MLEEAALRPDDPRLERLEFAIRGVAIHAVAAGPADGPLVVLLHGFPEFWYGWRHQILPIAEAGFRVVAPDQRGYNRSDKPEGVPAYHLDELAADVAGLIDACGHQAADVVGHDWGGVVAWWTALKHPGRVRRLVVLNAPHPIAMQKFARKNWRQLWRSRYIGFFQVPRLPERYLSLAGFAPLRRALTGSAPPGIFGSADLSAYRQTWSQPGALTAMLNWYRAMLKFRTSGTDLRVRQKTLILWGERDDFLESGLAAASARFCDDARVLLIERGSHWIQHERPRRVNAEILAFLGEGR
jgi:pimeloyl-ACP methyl ester carboxylesterase